MSCKQFAICRVKPPSGRDTSNVVANQDGELQVAHTPQGSKRPVCTGVRLDAALSPMASQSDVFYAAVKPTLSDLLSGHDVAIFAYGPTRTGKTYTMEGSFETDVDPGIVPLSMASILSAVAAGPYTETSVKISCLEMYCDEMSDLLAPVHHEASRLRVERRGGIHGMSVVDGLTEWPIETAFQVEDLVRKVQERRRLREGNSPGRGALSHVIYMVNIKLVQDLPDSEVEVNSRISFVDLAGSDCTRVNGRVLQNNGRPGDRTAANHVSHSLANLSACLAERRDLATGRRPYSASPLTLLLEDALSSSGCAVLLATVDPRQDVVEETLTTISYLEQSVGVQTHPVSALAVSIVPSEDELQRLRLEAARQAEESEFVRRVALASAVETDQARISVGEAEGQCATLHARLTLAQRALEEKNYLLNRTIAFADQRSAEAEALVEAVGAFRTNSGALAKELASRGTTTDAVRAHVRGLLACAEESMASRLNDAIKVPCAKADASVKGIGAAHARAEESMNKAILEQQRLLSGIASSVCEAAGAMTQTVTNHMAATTATANAELAATRTQLAVVEASTHVVTATCDKAHERVRTVATEGERRIKTEADALERELKSRTETHATKAEDIARDVREAKGMVAASSKATGISFGTNLSEPLLDLCKQLESCVKTAEEQRQNAFACAHHVRSDADAAAERRARIEETLLSVMESRAAESAKTLPRLVQALTAIGETLTERSHNAQTQLAASSQAVDGVRSRLEEDTKSSEATLRSHLTDADIALAEAWKEARALEIQLLNGLQSSGDSSVAMDAGGAAPKSMVDALLRSVKGIEEVRNGLKREVSALREQKVAHERIVKVLRGMQEYLWADLTQARKDSAVAMECVHAARADAARVVEETSRLRDVAAKSMQTRMEAWLRDEFKQMTDRLVTEGLVPITERIVEAQHHVSAAGDAYESVQQRACQSAGEASNLIQTVMAERENVCVSIESLQDRAAVAIQLVQRAATSDAKDLAAAVSSLRALQEHTKAKWADSRSAAEVAVGTWAEKGRHAAHGLAKALGQQREASQEVAALQTGVEQRRISAQESTEELAVGEQRHTEALAALAALHAQHREEDDAASARCRDALGSLGEALHVAVPSVTKCAAQAQSIGEAASRHVATLSNRREALLPVFASSEEAAQRLAADIRSGYSAVMGHVSQVRSANQEAAQATKCAAAESVQSVRIAAAEANQAVEAQRVAAAASAKSEEERWRELEKSLGPALREVQHVALKAARTGESVVSDSREELEHARREVERSQQSRREAWGEIVSNCQAALDDQMKLFRKGVAKEPLDAFSADEGQAGRKVFEYNPPELLPAAELALRQGIPARPDEDQLRQQFLAQHPPGADLAAAEAMAPRHSPDAPVATMGGGAIVTSGGGAVGAVEGACAGGDLRGTAQDDIVSNKTSGVYAGPMPLVARGGVVGKRAPMRELQRTAGLRF